MKTLLIAVSLLSFVHAAPQILRLKYYNRTIDVAAVEPGANLYLASNDDSRYLKKIQITSGGVTKTLDQLSNGDKFPIADKLTIQTANNQSDTIRLTGYLYVTTAAQVKDSTFSVIVVNGLTPLVANNFKSTTVILNTAVVNDFPPFDSPDKTTYVTNLKHANNVAVNFHFGIPDADYVDQTENQFFENPLTILQPDANGTPQRTKVFFDDVEPMQINLPYWYITANGPFLASLDSKYVDVHDHYSQSEKSTGALVITDVFMEQKFNFPVDDTKPGTTGIYFTANLDWPVNIYYYKSDQTSYQGYIGNKKQVLSSTNFATTQMTFNSTSLVPGTFYCQYFVIGEKMGPTPPTTTPFATISSTLTSLITSTFFSTTHGAAGAIDLLNLTGMFLMYILWRC